MTVVCQFWGGWTTITVWISEAFISVKVLTYWMMSSDAPKWFLGGYQAYSIKFDVDIPSSVTRSRLILTLSRPKIGLSGGLGIFYMRNKIINTESIIWFHHKMTSSTLSIDSLISKILISSSVSSFIFLCIASHLEQVKLEGISFLDAYSIFSLFFSPLQSDIIARMINLNAKMKRSDASLKRPCNRRIISVKKKRVRSWVDVISEKICVFTNIQIYMRIYLKKLIAAYWSVSTFTSLYSLIWKVMRLMWFKQIQQWFHVLDSRSENFKNSEII